MKDGICGSWNVILFTIVISAVIVFGNGCSLCTHKAVKDCEEWESKGYAVRIVQYEVGVDGLLVGLFLWPNHAQCQIYYEQEWLFVGEFGGLSRQGTFSRSGPLYWYELKFYKEAINGSKKTN